MGHREGISRAEPIRLNLEEHIAQDNPVRLIEAYVESLDLEELGFNHAVPEETGRPPYHPGDLLKLYIYGYLHRMRSSRQLEWACEVNIELWCLPARRQAGRVVKRAEAILADDSALPAGAPKEPAQVISGLCTKLEQLGVAGRENRGATYS